MSDARPSGPSVRLVLQIEGAKRKTVTLQISTERTLVGRLDEDSGAQLGLDLAPYGEGGGVSRTHAAFSYVDKAIVVQDLGSTNGTRLNGLELTPNQAYRIREGDELEFGHIRLTVRSA
jgi:pSer/pThr/pTyr-binding forkhead associated (FHA) protein